MLTHDEARDIFLECGALLEGHFQLTSGRHSGHYMEKFAVLQYPELTSRLCAEFARRFADADIDLVVGPATGGIVLAFETARIMGTRAIFTEREQGQMTLRRGFQVNPDERILVVEDIVTTGGSVREVLAALAQTTGEVVAVGLLCDRSDTGADFGVRTEPLLRLPIESWPPEECPLCAAQVPLGSRGSRHL